MADPHDDFGGWGPVSMAWSFRFFGSRSQRGEIRGQGPDGRGRYAPSVLGVSVERLTPVLASVDPACSADPVVIEDLHGRTLSG